MKRTLEEHAARFDEAAPEYDEDKSEEHRAAVSLVVKHADPGPTETVLDLGTGTGAVALALAEDADRVIGRDISQGMLEEARRKAEARGLRNVSFGTGRFRDPQIEEPVDVVVSNFAMHHLSDGEKRRAIETIGSLDPRRFVLGDVMFFEEADPDHRVYDPEVDDPATVGTLVEALTDLGFAVTAVERIHDQVGVLVADSR
ncbi:MAG: class I SAM-dependent methyltransferase [Halodesulfurarchaeum sp.]